MTGPAEGRYRVRPAKGADDLARLQELRAVCFGLSQPRDHDDHDAQSLHLLVEDAATDRLVCCFRLRRFTGQDLSLSYSAQFYDLERLAEFEGVLLELGRFCVLPERRDPDILRLAWSAIASFVDRHDVRLLFGCSSFAGTLPEPYLDAFALLKARHLAPHRWQPDVKAPEVYRFAARLRRRPDLRRAMLTMPPLLRSYLAMGGWVSDHAVIDHGMNTLHVFTGLEVARIPERRKILLRGLV
jgi:L-ornithine Nalpha-acyltransferase